MSIGKERQLNEFAIRSYYECLVPLIIVRNPIIQMCPNISKPILSSKDNMHMRDSMD